MAHKCPVCQKHTFTHMDSHDICPECGWEDDGLQIDDYDMERSSNRMSVNQARKMYGNGRIDLIRRNKGYSDMREDSPVSEALAIYRRMRAEDQTWFNILTYEETRFDDKEADIVAGLNKLRKLRDTTQDEQMKEVATRILNNFR